VFVAIRLSVQKDGAEAGPAARFPPLQFQLFGDTHMSDNLLPIPDGIDTWLISEARSVALFGFTVVPAVGDATYPPDLLAFLVPTARRLAIYGWSVTD
jgi:hypothetical protein